MPGGMGSGRGIVLVVGALAALWLLTGFYRVQPDEQGVVLRFGQWVRTAEPGLSYHLPAPFETVLLPNVTRINSIEISRRSAAEAQRGAERGAVDESLMLTGDENIVDIDYVVLWRIKDAGQYLFKIRDPEGTVKKAAESAIREIVGRSELQPILTEARARIETSTRQLLQTMLDEFQAGIEITQVQLQKVDPPASVIDAFNNVQRARADRERSRNEAETYRNEIIPRARGEAEQLIQDASAYREQVINLAQGESERFQKIYQAYSQSKGVLGKRLYLESMEDTLGGLHKVIIEGGPGGSGVLPYLPLDKLRPSAPGPAKAGQGAP